MKSNKQTVTSVRVDKLPPDAKMMLETMRLIDESGSDLKTLIENERNDIRTMENHLMTLEGAEFDIYYSMVEHRLSRLHFIEANYEQKRITVKNTVRKRS